MSIQRVVFTLSIISATGVIGCVDTNESQPEAISELSGVLETGMGNVAGGRGWQGKFTFNVATGLGGLFFHYGCPAAFPVAQSGGFLPNSAAAAGLVFLGNAPRLDLTPTGYNEWAWSFRWPAGAQAGAAINFDAYCVAGPP